MRPLVRGQGDRQREYVSVRATRRMSPLERVLLHRKVDSATGCWLSALTPDQETGYVSLTIDGRRQKSYRITYEALVGPIPAGLHIDHLCRNRACCNPAHLEAVTPLENTRRGHHPNVLATACPRGHEYDEENTYRANGRRYCRQCQRAYNFLYRQLTPEVRDALKRNGLPLVDLDAYFAEERAA